MQAGYFLWHIPAEGQFSQPQPHECLPFFLSLTIFTIIKATTPAKTIPIRIVDQYCFKNSSMPLKPPFYLIFTLVLRVVLSL